MRWMIGLALVALAAPAAARAEQLLHDGRYECTISGAFLGEILLREGTYAGPAFDGAWEEFHPYDEADGTIVWGGPLGGISLAGTVVATVVKKAGKRNGIDVTGFDITIENDSGNFQTVSCAPVD